MSKLGRPFEQAVAAVVAAFDPRASVYQGKWVQGPDGRRECDVLCERTGAQESWRILFECKDYNPKTTGPIGIGYVDALDSKRRDLACSAAIICSNAGFTADAVRKAKRVKIGLVSVMRKGDPRLRYAVIDEIYTRQLRAREISMGLHYQGSAIDMQHVRPDEVTHAGLLVFNWIKKRIAAMAAVNLIVNGRFQATHDLVTPQVFNLPTGPVLADRLDFYFTLTGTWLAHRIRIDAGAGMYDWLRRRVRLASGPNKIEYAGLNFEGGTQLALPPETEFLQEQQALAEVDVKFLMFESFGAIDPAPQLDELVRPHDLDLVVPGISDENRLSHPANADT
ncbi:MAG: restriction endonuclease [Thiobacillaceae bacterium]